MVLGSSESPNWWRRLQKRAGTVDEVCRSCVDALACDIQALKNEMDTRVVSLEQAGREVKRGLDVLIEHTNCVKLKPGGPQPIDKDCSEAFNRWHHGMRDAIPGLPIHEPDRVAFLAGYNAAVARENERRLTIQRRIRHMHDAKNEDRAVAWREGWHSATAHSYGIVADEYAGRPKKGDD